MQTARIASGVIQEFLLPVEGFTLAECFHPDILAETAQAPDNAQIGWTFDGTTFAAPMAAAPSAAIRSAPVSALLDVLSSTQRAEITADHMSRLVARAAIGPVIITDPKVQRAATDMSLTPDVWFTLAGV